MRAQRVALGLTVVNLLLLLLLVAERVQPAVAVAAKTPAGEVVPVLRGRSLEIVDEQNRVRAMIAVMPPSRVDGKDYPETVLLRMIDPKSGPLVKLAAARDGSGLLLSDDAEGGFQILAKESGNTLKVMDRAGGAQLIEP